MSVVILGGNECMERRYKDLCQSYKCSAKVFTKPSGGLKNKLGSPDLMIFFTSTMSHKLVQSALSELKGTPTRIERCHTSSLSALRSILEKHAVPSSASHRPAAEKISRPPIGGRDLSLTPSIPESVFPDNPYAVSMGRSAASTPLYFRVR